MQKQNFSWTSDTGCCLAVHQARVRCLELSRASAPAEDTIEHSGLTSEMGELEVNILFTKEVVVAMNPLHSQRKERNVLRGSSGTIPGGGGRGVRLQILQIKRNHMPVCPELSEGGGDVCLRGGAGGGALPLK